MTLITYTSRYEFLVCAKENEPALIEKYFTSGMYNREHFSRTEVDKPTVCVSLRASSRFKVDF